MTMQSVMTGTIETFRGMAEKSPLKSAACIESPERLIISTGVGFAPLNGVFEKNGEAPLNEKEVDELIEFFSLKKLPFIWWSSDKILDKKGLLFSGIFKGVAANLSSIPKPTRSPLPGLVIKQAQTEEEIENFTQLLIEVMGLSPSLVQPYSSVNQSLHEHGEQIHYLAYVDGLPVATVSLTHHGETAGLWNGVTLPDHRRKGILTSLIHTALDEARKRKCQNVIGVTMPKGMSYGILCRDLGFKEVGELYAYMWGSDPAQLEK